MYGEGSTDAGAKPAYARPPAGRDYAFFYDGVQQKKLYVQKCDQCGTVRNPPGPMCGHCNSLKWTPLECSGKGTVYSYTIHYYPPLPYFKCPHPVVLVDMEEGHRHVAHLAEMPLDEIKIGMPVQVEFFEIEDGYILHRFRRAD